MPNLPSIPALTVRAIRATPVEVPLNFVLGTSMGAVRQAPLLLIDLETEEGSPAVPTCSAICARPRPRS